MTSTTLLDESSSNCSPVGSSSTDCSSGIGFSANGPSEVGASADSFSTSDASADSFSKVSFVADGSPIVCRFPSLTSSASRRPSVMQPVSAAGDAPSLPSSPAANGDPFIGRSTTGGEGEGRGKSSASSSSSLPSARAVEGSPRRNRSTG
ncbi:unnamed protein product [Closterium sp. NIES-54]